jgi:hypothetical protein
VKNYVLLRKPENIGNKWEQFTAQAAVDKRAALRQAGAKRDDGYNYRVIPAADWKPVVL